MDRKVCVTMNINQLKLYLITILMFSLMQIVLASSVNAHIRFQSNYPCTDTVKTCVSSGVRAVEGFSVHRDCWEWSYAKSCNSPSKNDCAQHSRCYSLGTVDCLLRDFYGNCINLKKEFSCKRKVAEILEFETVRYGLQEKEGKEGLFCKGVPCMDGNCIDKSYEMDGDMISSVGQLGALAQGKNVNATFKIFEGLSSNCSKKAASYSNCCRVSQKGWGKSLGAKCSKEEQDLADRRGKNLCVYVGKTKNKTLGATMIVKEHYCCWGNLLEKTIQVQARKQLNMNFGSGGSTNCRGLTLEELGRVDFSKLDFSEVAAQMQKKIALPNTKDIENRLNDSYKNTTTKFDEKTPSHPKNKAAGVNRKVMKDED